MIKDPTLLYYFVKHYQFLNAIILKRTVAWLSV